MRILIVGGVAGGAAAAARARRLSEDSEIIMFERDEHVSFANCGLPYFAGEIIKDKKALLVQSPATLKKWFNIDVRIKNEVISIERKQKRIKVIDLDSGNEYFENYDYLILSPGAEPVIPPVEGADLSCVKKVRSIHDVESIRSALRSRKLNRVVVVGAGFIGVEMAENLHGLGIETHIIEKLNQVLPVMDAEMAVIAGRKLTEKGIVLHLDDPLAKIEKNGSGCIVETSSGKKIESDIVVLSIGVKPETELAARAGLELGRSGIRVDAKMRTSDKSIFAVGDAVETQDPVTGDYRCVPLAGPAAKQAIIAVNNIFNIESSYRGSFGTSILKVFDLTAGMTGASEKALRASGIKYEKIYTFPFNHVNYYPGASPLSVKVMFDADSGVVLGAQVIGKSGVDKKVDLLSVAVKHRLTVDDIAGFELCYAPPYGSAKDALNLAGMTAQNHLRGITRLKHWDNLNGTEFLLDVRTPGEYVSGSVDNAVNIPVDEIRNRIPEIPKEKEIAVFCQVGIRAHIACRILTQKGFKAVNISGGYKSYLNFKDSGMLKSKKEH